MMQPKTPQNKQNAGGEENSKQLSPLRDILNQITCATLALGQQRSPDSSYITYYSRLWLCHSYFEILPFLHLPSTHFP